MLLGSVGFDIHKLDKIWVAKVMTSEKLTQAQKEELIKRARKQVLIENLKEIALLPLKIIGTLLLAFALMWLIGWFQSLGK